MVNPSFFFCFVLFFHIQTIKQRPCYKITTKPDWQTMDCVHYQSKILRIDFFHLEAGDLMSYLSVFTAHWESGLTSHLSGGIIWLWLVFLWWFSSPLLTDVISLSASSLLQLFLKDLMSSTLYDLTQLAAGHVTLAYKVLLRTPKCVFIYIFIFR